MAEAVAVYQLPVAPQAALLPVKVVQEPHCRLVMTLVFHPSMPEAEAVAQSQVEPPGVEVPEAAEPVVQVLIQEQPD
jgi:hypothetical protein